MQRERDKLVSEVAKLTEKLNNALNYQEELERRTSQADLKINEFAEQIEVNLRLVKMSLAIYFKSVIIGTR